MSLVAWTAALAQSTLAGCAIALGWHARVPWLGLASLGLLAVSGVGGRLATTVFWRRLNLAGVISGWGGSLVVPACLFRLPEAGFSVQQYLDLKYTVLAWLMTTILLPLSARASLPRSQIWPVAAIACTFAVSAHWLASTYMLNQRFLFLMGLPPAVAILVVAQVWLRLPTVGHQVMNTLILLLVGVPLADLCRPPPRVSLELDEAKRYYSYGSARKDPIAFMRWWGLFNKEWDRMSKALFMRDPTHAVPYRVRPNAEGRLFQSAIRMNSLGFRGRDFAREKGSTYRVIALGESTTFGCTLGAGDRAWPELLEEMIQERIQPNRPVEVINAGLPGFNLRDNLRRLADQILPLAPDLILSYHGYNGFVLLDSALPAVSGHMPQYKERPLRLLADVEYRYEMLKCRHRLGAKTAGGGAGFTNVLQSDYAEAYRRLIKLAKSNGVSVVVANFSMAVNAQSDPEEVAFYQLGFPFVDRAIKANAAHSELLRLLAQEFPDVCFVNTQAKLDGHHEKFVDLVHLTQEGRQDVAEAFFLGIRDLLKAQLAQPAPQPRVPGSAPEMEL